MHAIYLFFMARNRGRARSKATHRDEQRARSKAPNRRTRSKAVPGGDKGALVKL